MPWGPEDWELWTANTCDAPSTNHPEYVTAARSILDQIPGRDSMMVFAPGDPLPPCCRFDVVLALDSILGPRLADFDHLLVQLYGSLREGGLLVASFPAVPRGEVAPRPFRLEGSREPSGEMLRHHEAELQYRLTRAGFQGIRLRRFVASESDTLLAVATRRALN